MTGYARMGAVAGAATVFAGMSLNAVFADGAWLPYLVSAAGTVAVAGMALRALRAPVWAQGLGLPAALLVYLCVCFGPGGWSGLLPTPGTLRALGDLAAGGFDDVAALAAPVSSRPGLTLLTAAGLGLVAIAVDLLAVGLRRASFAGAPLLAVYTVPVAVSNEPVGWYWFVLGGFGYLWLLRTDSTDRLRRWGPPFRPGAATAGSAEAAVAAPPRPTGAVGVTFAGAAVVAALLVPALLPSLSTAGLFTTGEGAGFGSTGGGRNVETVNPITRLKGELQRRDNKELLSVRTDDRDPFYLRLTTLDVFRRADGWSQSTLEARQTQRVGNTVPEGNELDTELPGTTVNTTVDVRGLTDSRYLPIYAGTQSLDVAGDWRWEPRTQTVFSVRTNTDGLTYRLRSYRADYDPALLAASKPMPPTSPVSLRFGSIPPDRAIQAIVDDIVAGKRTPYARALALNSYFSGDNGFRYSLRTKQGSSGDALLDFLRNKEGYCEQYASAMAYMARRAGLPARVAIGFTRGDKKSGRWSIGTRDAHAWVEIYFRDIGWVPFDPTPLGGEGNAVTLPYTVPAAPRPGEPGTGSPGVANPGTAGPAPLNPKADQLDRAESRDTAAAPPELAAQGRTSGIPRWPAVLGGLLPAVLLVLPPVARVLRRRRRFALLSTAGAPVDAAHAAWDEIVDTLTDLRTPVADAETPRAAVARIAELGEFDEDGRAALRLLAHAEERARYAAAAVAPDGLAGAVEAVRSRLLAAAGRRAVLRAALAPTSVIESASAWAGSAGDRLAAPLQRLRLRLQPHTGR
jgi:transglutaminase-like putative cysteine protease